MTCVLLVCIKSVHIVLSVVSVSLDSVLLSPVNVLPGEEPLWLTVV